MDANLIRPKGALGSFLVLMAILAGSTPNGFGQPGGETNCMPFIWLTDVSTRWLVSNFCQVAAINYILDPRAETNHTILSARWTNITILQALDRVLASNGLRRVQSPATTVTRITFPRAITKFADPSWVKADTNGATPQIQMSSVPLREAITKLASNAQQRVEFDPRLAPRWFSFDKKVFDLTRGVNFQWENLTPRQALAAVCENYDLVLTANSSNNVIKLSPFVP